MKKSDFPIDSIIADYNNGVSTYVLAERYGTSPNMIRRILLKAGVAIRNRSDAQKTAIEQGTATHPTAGKKRTEAEILSVSRGLSLAYQNLSEEEKQRRADNAKAQWNNKTDQQKKDMSTAAAKGVLVASKEGSKFERELVIALKQLGYHCQHHSSIVANEKMEVDIFVPELKVCIEVDGPAHFLPIYGDKKLQRVQQSDRNKNGLLISNGYIIIRIRTEDKPSLAATADIVKKLDDILKNVRENFPPISDRYIQIG